MKYHVLLLSLLLNFLCLASTTNLKFEYQVKTETLFDLKLTFAQFELTLDEPLFFVEPIHCTPGCKELPQDCSPCDYSKKESCGSTQSLVSSPSTQNTSSTNNNNNSNSNSNSNSNNNNKIQCECPNKEEWCHKRDTSFNNWETLEDGKELGPFAIDDETPFLYTRFYFDKPCHGVHVRVFHHYGMSVINLDTNLDVQDLVFYDQFPFLTLCPRDFIYQFGTYGIKMSRKNNQATKFSIKISFVDFGSDEHVQIDEPKKCDDDPYQAFCLGQNTMGPVSLAPIQFGFFRMTISECVSVLVHSEKIFSNLGKYDVEGFLYKYDTPPVSSGSPGISGPHSEIISFCPTVEGKESHIYFTIVSPVLSHQVLITVTIDTTKGFLEKKSFSEYGVEELSYLLMGTFDLVCGKKSWTCRPMLWQHGLSCLEVWTIIPTRERIGLWPRPIFLSNQYPDTFLNLPFSSQEKGLNDTLSGGFILEISESFHTISTLSDWETNLESECQFVLPQISRFITQSNMGLGGVFKLTNNQREEKCDFEEFSRVSQEIDTLTQQFSSLIKVDDILASRYMIDSQSFSSHWQDCEHYIQRFLDFETQKTEIQNTKDCPQGIVGEIETDACCNSEVAWNQCCTNRDIEVNKNVMRVGKDSIQKQKNQCPSQECLDSFLEDYIFNIELRDSQLGCKTVVTESLSQKQFEVLEFLRVCKNRFFGEDGFGIDCDNDNQCDFGCDLFEHKCVFKDNVQLSQVNNMFFECIDENISLDTRTFIQQKHQSEQEEQKDFILLLKENYLIEECVSSVGRSADSYAYSMTPLNELVCSTCDFYCFDKSCVPPLRCESTKEYGRPESLCPFSELFIPSDHEKCLSKQVCNWNSSIQNQEECSQSNTTSFGCAFCETPSSCRLVEGVESKEHCEELNEGCILGEEILVGLSETECLKKSYCSQPCENCDSEKECELNGWCSDQEYLQIIGDAPAFDQTEAFKTMPHKNDGLPKDQLIFRQMSAWNKPDCAFDKINWPEVPTRLGCLILSNYTWQYYLDNSLPLTTIPLSKTQEECERFHTCFEENIVTDLSTPKSQQECELCRGKYEKVFEWSNAKWMKGKSGKLEWIERRMVPKNRIETTIDFDSLAKDISDSVTQDYSLEIQTQAQCRLNGLKSVMDSLLCLCLEGGGGEGERKKERNCSQNQNEEMESGVGKICSGQNTTLVIPPTILDFQTNSLQEDDCVSLSVILELSSYLSSSPKKSVSSSFRKEVHHGDRVKNKKGDFVGKFVGNGVFLKFEGKPQFNEFRMCLSFDESKHKLENDQQFDFAYLRENKEEVRPLGMKNVEKNDGLLCVFVNEHQISSPLFPIIRNKDWENSSPDTFTEQQISVYVLMFFLFLIPSIILFVKEAITFGTGYWQESKLFPLFLISSLIVRCLYFMILLIEQNSGNETIGEFLTLIFPTFSYLSAVSVAAMLWALVTTKNLKRSKTHSHSSSIIRIVCGIVNVCLYSLFILVVITFYVYVDDSEEESCLGRVSESGDSSNLEMLRIIYLTLIGSFTLLIVCSMLYFTGNVVVTFSLFKNTSTMANNRIRRWMLVTLLTALSVLSQCVFQICYTLFVSPSELYALFLVPIEVIPIVIVIFITIVHHDHTPSSSSSGNVREMGTIVPGSMND